MLIITFGNLTNYGGSKRREREREGKNRGKRRKEREEDKKWVERELRWKNAFMSVSED